MKVVYKPTRAMTVEIEGAGVKDLFARLAEVSEAFGVSECGACGGEDLGFIHRENDGNSFLERSCKGCGARLSMSQKKDQKTIYPRRRFHKEHPEVKAGRVKEGDWIPNGGWEKFAARDAND